MVLLHGEKVNEEWLLTLSCVEREIVPHESTNVEDC